MAFANGKFFVEDNLQTTFPHHESFKALWETKWKKPCSLGIYPFMFAALADFEPIAEQLIKGDVKRPYNWETYADYFFPRAEELVSIAETAEKAGELEKASEYYLRASAIYRIARFPSPRSPKQWEAWSLSKKAALNGFRLENPPMTEMLVPHTHASNGDGSHLPVFYSLPSTASAANPVPLLIIFCGLDGYRPELAINKYFFLSAGIAVLITEIPGTGDNPGNPSDPESPDRVWSSLFDWIEKQPEIDKKRVVNWGFSTGGYYSIRVAHTHAHRLKGVVAQGGGCHGMFDARWLSAVSNLEYPFDLTDSLCHKFGYQEIEVFKKEAQNRYSLLNDGTLDRACTKLLLVNGMEDSIFPIDDCFLCLQYGNAKTARFIPGAAHMGEPRGSKYIIEWLGEVLGMKLNHEAFTKSVIRRPKY